MNKNILVIGLTSELAENTIKELKNKNWNIYATTRQVEMMDDKIHEFHLDVTNELDFIELRDKLKKMNLKFDVILNFTGIAIAGAVEELNEIELRKQFEINFYGLLKIIKYIAPFLEEKGRLINTSSMATYGIFPFLAPYCASKSAADILLNTYSIENKVKTVSIRPGAVATKFWESSIEINKQTLELNKGKFEEEKRFLIDNANKNSLHATNPIYVAKKIAQIVEHKNPKPVYNIGLDAKVAKLTRFLPQKCVNNLVKIALKLRIKKKQK